VLEAGLLVIAGFGEALAGEPTLQTNSETGQVSDRMAASAVCGRGVSVAVHRTKIFTSPDQIHWTARDSGSPSSLYGAAFGGDRFVAVGNEGLILSSPDGLRWSIEISATDERLRGIAYGQSKFVAVGHRGVIVTSRDGQNWRRQDSGTETRLQAVAWGNGLFVAVGWKGTVLTSENGTDWVRRAQGIQKNLIGWPTATPLFGQPIGSALRTRQIGFPSDSNRT
jgi:hypothetical protein